MKKIATSLLIFASSLGAFAQIPTTSGGPDGYGYSWMSSADTSAGAPSFEWIDIKSSGTVISNALGDDNTAGPFSIGFNMPFYWYTTNTFFIGSNGYIMFDKATTISSTSNPAFPVFPTNTDNHESFVAPFLADLNFTEDNAGVSVNPATVYFWSNNVDSMILTFDSVAFWDGNMGANGFSGSNTFQVIFNGNDQSIKINYLNQSGVWNSGYDGDPGASQIGMESVGAVEGLQVASAVYPDDSLTVLISLAPDTTFSVTDVQAAGNNSTKNGGIFVSQNRPTTLTTNIKNIGTTDINSSFNVNVKVALSPTGGAARYSTVETINSLNAGVNNEIAVGLPFNPIDTANLINPNINPGESYFMSTDFSVSGDLNGGNDQIASEIAVVADTAKPLSAYDLTFSNMELASGGGFGFEGGGVYMKPPYYPIDIVALNYFFATPDDGSQPTQSFYARLWLDDGANGAPGTLASDDTVTGAQITLNNSANENGMTQVFLASPVTITSGGFYVGMQYQDFATADFQLLEDVSGGPKSNQNYEILAGTFGEYRSNADADLMMGVTIDASAADTNVYGCTDPDYEEYNPQATADDGSCATLIISGCTDSNYVEYNPDATVDDGSCTTLSISPEALKAKFGVYPNPAENNAVLKIVVNASSNVSYDIKNVIGQEIISEDFGMVSPGNQIVNLDISNFESGVYFVTVNLDNKTATQKFVVK